jgi:hypothetical protein
LLYPALVKKGCVCTQRAASLRWFEVLHVFFNRLP